jgi:uncharacterized protein with NRDE domain
MCTVSFYHDNSKVIITSNRDEHINRPSAIPPKKMIFGAKTIYYPKDPQAGGTWFAVNSIGFVFVLLNGAEAKHISNPPYRKSRGLVLLDIINSNNFLEEWNMINLSNIEPFTIIAFVDHQLFQIRWNEIEKSLIQLDSNKAYIWSSTTLYSEAVISIRESWFSEFLNQNKENICSDDFISFHTNTQKNDTQNGLVMNRNNSMLTKNITQCEITKSNFTLTHFDLISQEKSIITEVLI